MNQGIRNSTPTMSTRLHVGVHDRIASGEVRRDFPMLDVEVDGSPLVYLDNAATSLKPRAVIDAVADYFTCYTANIHRGRHMLSEKASDKYEEARSRVATFVGCASNEVIFVRNTTEAINLSAQIIDLAPDDLVIGTLDSHHSQILPWMSRARLELVKQRGDGTVDLDHFADLLRRRPKVVAVTVCSNVTGVYAPTEEMLRMARDVGAVTVLDAAQAVAHHPLDFTALGADFLAFSSHKMLGPSGVGCLIARADALRNAVPSHLGGGTVDHVTVGAFQLRKIPHRFEPGTPAIESTCGLAAAVDYLSGVGFAALVDHDRRLVRRFLDEARERDYIQLVGGPGAENRAPIFSFSIEGVKDLSDVTRTLSDSYGIMCRNGHLCAQPYVDAYTDSEVLRVSAYLYNTVEEIAYVFECLDEIARTYRKQSLSRRTQASLSRTAR